MTTSAELLKQFQKDHGKHFATTGGQDEELVDCERMPTGIFPVDLAMGGGFPKSKCSEVFGPESSNKTNLVLQTIRQAQIMEPKKKNVFVDVEHALDKKWARDGMGVNLDNLILIQPSTAEQAVDAVSNFIYAEDVNIVAMDSIAMMMKKREMEEDAEAGSYGGAALLVGKMYRKVTGALAEMELAGKMGATFIAINQIRSKMSATKGSDEVTPGGFPPRFCSAMRVRVYGKNEMDTAIDKAMPSWKEVNIIIKKWKCPILAVNAVYKMQMIKGLGRSPGYINDWNTISAYMKELDYLSKGEKGGWIMNGMEFKLLEECKEALYSDPAMLQDIKTTIIKELKDLREQGDDFEATGEIPTEA